MDSVRLHSFNEELLMAITRRELLMMKEIDNYHYRLLELRLAIRAHFLADTVKKHEETRSEILKLCGLKEKDFDF